MTRTENELAEACILILCSMYEDDKVGGTNNIALISASVNSTTQGLTLQWQRAQNTHDAYDVAIDPASVFYVAWATGVCAASHVKQPSFPAETLFFFRNTQKSS